MRSKTLVIGIILFLAGPFIAHYNPYQIDVQITVTVYGPETVDHTLVQHEEIIGWETRTIYPYSIVGTIVFLIGFVTGAIALLLPTKRERHLL